jgi:hypothetical protein
MSDGDVFTLLLTGRFDLPHHSGPRSEEMANIKTQTPTHDARFDKTKPTVINISTLIFVLVG